MPVSCGMQKRTEWSENGLPVRRRIGMRLKKRDGGLKYKARSKKKTP